MRKLSDEQVEQKLTDIKSTWKDRHGEDLPEYVVNEAIGDELRRRQVSHVKETVEKLGTEDLVAMREVNWKKTANSLGESKLRVDMSEKNVAGSVPPSSAPSTTGAESDGA